VHKLFYKTLKLNKGQEAVQKDPMPFLPNPMLYLDAAVLFSILLLLAKQPPLNFKLAALHQ
jgi:hypothetical protein